VRNLAAASSSSPRAESQGQAVPAPPALQLEFRLRRDLLDVLTDSRRRGFLGPGSVDDQLEIALVMGSVVERALASVSSPAELVAAEGARRGDDDASQEPAAGHPVSTVAASVTPGSAGAGRAVAEVLDLGAGGGVPGLVAAAVWPRVRWTLLDAQQRRVAFLADMVDRLGLGARVEVVRERAELFGRSIHRRERYSAVVARGFGSPSATAEMAAPSLRLGGALLVSEPPGSTGERWPDGPLRQLGLVCRRIHRGVPAVVELHRERPCPSWAPRRVGIPAKRPLF